MLQDLSEVIMPAGADLQLSLLLLYLRLGVLALPVASFVLASPAGRLLSSGVGCDFLTA